VVKIHEHLGIIFNESYLFDVRISKIEIRFECDFAILPGHPEYSPPTFNERYCYKRGSLTFTSFTNYEWLEQHMKLIPSDLDEQLDYGTIDEFSTKSNSYFVGGEWGRLRIDGGEYAIEF
jgi:hypothetical protein